MNHMQNHITIRTCVTPQKRFFYAIHKPQYTVKNLRGQTAYATLGKDKKEKIMNQDNYPDDTINVENADWIYEIRNPFSFRGATYINKEWADNNAKNHDRIRIISKPDVSMHTALKKAGAEIDLASFPEPGQLCVARSSTDERDIVELAHISCDFIEIDGVLGLVYSTDTKGQTRPVIHNHILFEAVANNPHLPDTYKTAMVIRPGAQGKSEIVGDYIHNDTIATYEYLRRNSYIAGGHYAANMSENSIRYSLDELRREDMRALRHLYYQRTYIRLANRLGLPVPDANDLTSPEQLERLRIAVKETIDHCDSPYSATLWGWNYGFDYAPSKYRLHASHQQIHQQYAMLPSLVDIYNEGYEQSIGTCKPYGCGELIATVIDDYFGDYNRDFFLDYLGCIQHNCRLDGREDYESSLVVWKDDHVILFVPKAQTSQWELQLMTLPASDGSVAGNCVETNSVERDAIDTGIFYAQKALSGLGVHMVTTIEYPKPFDRKNVPLTQPLLYCFLPRLPESPGAFSEAQLRFINRHYPEDFAAVCRNQIDMTL